ncbi:unnamed protein product [Leptidea sinapis]|uniref:Uncharacterized protein n=1 Tax=Leptidea sinapis TaxID=189913 RepID=A0A5E4QZL4_9NEOP|nr:unnamed protein product [Leptidea sinapis]
MMVRRSGRYTVNWRGFRDFTANKPPDDRSETEDTKAEEDLSNHEVIFLRSIVESPDFLRKYKSADSEEDLIVKPVSLDNLSIIRSLSEYRGNNIRTIEQAELAILLSRVHFRAVIDAHDQIGKIWLERGSGVDEKVKLLESNSEELSADQNGEMPVETVKVVGLRKVPGQPLGLTVTTDEHGQLIVARIMAGSAAAKQALLNVGDVLLEVDGVQVDTEEQLKQAVSKPNDRVTLKVGPNLKDKNGQSNNKLSCYVRALFDYSPVDDSLIPCKEIGLEFKRGDIMQVSDRKDPNWWQASHVDKPDVVGLIPSPELEERRKAYVPPEADFVHKISICGARISRKKKKFVYESRSSVQLEGAELALYEEVARTPPFLRRVLALVGTRGVGRRTLKNRMIQEHPDRFTAVLPHTSRPPRPLEENGSSYWFVSREEMERDAHAGRFLEYGEHNGHLYGTHLDSIRAAIKEVPQVVTQQQRVPALRGAGGRAGHRTPQEPDARFQQEPGDTTYSKIMDALHALSTDHQWVPVSWIY